jgi:adenylate cyclase
MGWAAPEEETIDLAFDYVKKARELDPSMGQAHFSASMLHMIQKNHDLAIQAAAAAVQHNPNYADGWAQYAQALVYNGQPEEGLLKLARAMELNPRYAFFYTWIQGKAYMLLGQLDLAEQLFLEVIERNAHFLGAHLTLAAIYAQQDRIDDAEFEAAEILALFPDFSIAAVEKLASYRQPEHLAFYIDGLRKAGLPE